MQITEKAPYFKGVAVMPDKEFKEIQLSDYRGKWLVLFFYPLDFTFVCPTEIKGFAANYKKFTEVGAEVIGCSVDSQFSHLAWVEKDLKPLPFPLMSDLSKNISRAYDVLVNDSIALRGTFIIDPEGVLKSIVINDTAIGRSIDETVRTLKALQTGELTGCGWQPGETTLGKG
ncbi:MAG: peroxiredoxin [candidate division Zixibacteria bacterium]|nr:peroxiredoxin [candidate division Zixibacteria bacterium]